MQRGGQRGCILWGARGVQRGNWNVAHSCAESLTTRPLGKKKPLILLNRRANKRKIKRQMDTASVHGGYYVWQSLRANFDTDVREPWDLTIPVPRGKFVNVFVADNMNPIPARRATHLETITSPNWGPVLYPRAPFLEIFSHTWDVYSGIKNLYLILFHYFSFADWWIINLQGREKVESVSDEFFTYPVAEWIWQK